MIAASYSPLISLEVDYFGKNDVVCQDCNARNFAYEQKAHDGFSLCCSDGKLALDPLNDTPECIKDLLLIKSDGKLIIFLIDYLAILYPILSTKDQIETWFLCLKNGSV